MPTKEQVALSNAELETERAVLGSILATPEHVYEATTEIQADDFQLASHRHIYRAMLAVCGRNEAIDYHTLAAELGAHGVLESCGGTAYLAELTTNAVRRKSLTSHLRLVKDRSLRRQAVAQGTRFLETLGDPSEETRGCLDMMHNWLLDLESGDRTTQAEPVGAFEEQVYGQLVQQSKETDRIVLGIPTGLPGLDELTTGIRKSEYWIVAGWPGHGKTALMMQMALAAAEQDDARVGIFSMEMRRDQLLIRLWAALANIPAWKLRNPRSFDDSDRRRLQQARQDHPKLSQNVYIDDSTGLTPQSITARAHLMIRRHGCEVIFCDYMQKIRAAGRDRREKVTAASEGFFNLTRATTVPVVVLSQLSRPKDKELGGEPSMFMLKESGDLEADADTILLIHRKFKGDQDPDEIIIGKQRNGQTDARVKVRFDGSRLRFEETEGKPAAQSSRDLEFGDKEP